MNEKLNQTQEKQFLTLHITHKGQQKTLHFGIRHAVAICTAAAIAVGGAVYSTSAYQQAKTELMASQELLLETERTNRKLEQRAELLQSENTEFNENITEIQNKTSQLEQKMNELETVKDDLCDQINHLNAAAVSGTEACAAMTAALETPVAAEPEFTNIVTTSYDKAASLSTQLDKMNAMMEETGISFTNVADEVTVTLAEHNNIPNGYPIESTIVTTEFNPTGNPSISDGRTHKGIDISTRSRIIPVMATAGGTVVTSKYDGAFGNCVVIDHGNGFTTLYAHNSELLVNVGDQVEKGDPIAMTGSTGMSSGVHCHYEIQLNGVYQNPRDYF